MAGRRSVVNPFLVVILSGSVSQDYVLLLAGVLESFRDVTLPTLGLDPAHYASSPRLAWDCMMK
jgi:hypothetical protein